MGLTRTGTWKKVKHQYYGTALVKESLYLTHAFHEMDTVHTKEAEY